MNPPSAPAPGAWRDAWPDALAFVVGLGVAWFWSWDTTDLVWSLWLSSFVVGYALIVWTVSATLRDYLFNASRDKSAGPRWAKKGGGALILVGTLFVLAFFTVHFGGFHFGHSVFLNHFFPVGASGESRRGLPSLALYGEVFRRYWIFLPAAFLAERAAFQKKPLSLLDPAAAVAPTDKRKATFDGSGLVAPYKNVVRMHLLIFFFAGAYVAHIDSFLVYTVVYAVYFFPWRLVRRKVRTAGAAVADRA